MTSMHAVLDVAPPLLRLPLELRRMIYAYVLPCYQGIYQVPFKRYTEEGCLSMPDEAVKTRGSLAILYVNRQIHEETAFMFYSETTFHLSIYPWGCSCLDINTQKPKMSQTAARVRRWQIEFMMAFNWPPDVPKTPLETSQGQNMTQAIEVFAGTFAEAEVLMSLDFTFKGLGMLPFELAEDIADFWIEVLKPFGYLPVKRQCLMACLRSGEPSGILDKQCDFSECLRIAELINKHEETLNTKIL
ncbi:MAG: hypothetical protein Q9220_005946 [cf. Caloplaca sp. 1 TL-2023]